MTTQLDADPIAAQVINLIQLSFGELVSQALYVSAKIGVADLLAEKPLHTVTKGRYAL